MRGESSWGDSRESNRILPNVITDNKELFFTSNNEQIMKIKWWYDTHYISQLMFVFYVRIYDIVLCC